MKSSYKGIVRPIREQFQQFVNLETLSGIILLACSAIALILSNSSMAAQFDQIWETNMGIIIGNFELTHSIHYWINDGLMAIFFFVIGLEIKRELLFGELASRKKVMLPVIAATGGAVVPALFYSLFNAGTEGANGWGIPMATDIAFVLGIIALLGRQVPKSIKIFVLAFAIIDDLIAILVIAAFYTSAINISSLLIGIGIMIAAFVLNRIGFYRTAFFLLLGIISWFAILDSGVHPTIAGVIMAFTVPSLQKTRKKEYAGKVKPLLSAYSNIKEEPERDEEKAEQQKIISKIQYYSATTESHMDKLIHLLHPVSSFFIIPLFALANAGIQLDANIFNALLHPISIGIITGLFIGKPVGIFLSIWASVKFKLAALPTGTNWKHIIAMACLGGMGFTLSLFISVLAFGSSPLLVFAKFGVLTGSLFSVATGCILFATSQDRAAKSKPAEDSELPGEQPVNV